MEIAIINISLAKNAEVKMENKGYVIYKLEEILDLYTNVSGTSQLKHKSIEETIDKQLEVDLLEDMEVPENEIETVTIDKIKRYQNLVNDLKKKCGYKCQICGYSFQMNNGNYYCEAHHVKYLSQDGSQSPDNVIILCPNHHRMFHYSSEKIVVGEIMNGQRKVTIAGQDYYIDV